MTRRDRLEIVKDILELCLTPCKKTRIVYQCNLNFKIVKRYLSWCFTHGWLKEDNSLYSTTALGRDYLNLLKPVLVINAVDTIQHTII